MPYGPLKAYSEKEVMKTYPDAYTIIRPGLIVGPLDRTDRFTYWPYRIDKGGEVLAPGDGNDAVQFIDVRDLAEWMIRVAMPDANSQMIAMWMTTIATRNAKRWEKKAVSCLA